MYSEKGTLKSYGGYRHWASTKTSLPDAKKGVSKQVEISYGAAVPNLISASMLTVASLLSFSLI